MKKHTRFESIDDMIYENNKIELILQSLGCHHIKEWYDRYSCCNPDGDNAGAVNIYKNEYLNAVNYTRDINKISTLKRNTQGVRLISLKENQTVTSVTITEKEEEEVIDNTEENNN